MGEEGKRNIIGRLFSGGRGDKKVQELTREHPTLGVVEGAATRYVGGGELPAMTEEEEGLAPKKLMELRLAKLEQALTEAMQEKTAKPGTSQKLRLILEEHGLEEEEMEALLYRANPERQAVIQSAQKLGQLLERAKGEGVEELADELGGARWKLGAALERFSREKIDFLSKAQVRGDVRNILHDAGLEDKEIYDHNFLQPWGKLPK